MKALTHDVKSVFSGMFDGQVLMDIKPGMKVTLQKGDPYGKVDKVILSRLYGTLILDVSERRNKVKNEIKYLVRKNER